MKIAAQTLIGLGLALSIAGTAAAGTTIKYNKGKTVREALVGNTVVGQLSDGTSYCEYHDANRGVFGRDFQVYAGNWSIKNNYICYVYPNYGKNCYRARVVEGRIKYMSPNTGAMIAKGAIVKGNVCS